MATWIIQSNLLSNSQVIPMARALREEGIPFVDVVVIPFSEEPLEIATTDPVLIPYGSTRFVKIAGKMNMKGLFFPEEKFKSSVYLENRDDMLNSCGKIFRLGDFTGIQPLIDKLWFVDNTFFVRPNDDLKLFAGGLTTKDTFYDDMARMSYGEGFNPDTKILISPALNILAEWRYFVVDGKIVSGSMYRAHGQMHQEIELDPAVLAEAQEKADGWLPHPTCVMDLALTKEGLKVVEFNGINASGFYHNDLNKVVRAVTDYTEKLYG